jgi:hypothetical protein
MISRTQLKQQIEQLADRRMFEGKVERGLQDSNSERQLSESLLTTKIKKWSS